KNGKNLALRALSPENGRPLCLKGRLTTELLNVDNPKQPYKKIGGEFVEASWNNVLGLDKILDKIEKIDN
ncbi:MAG: Fe-S-binding domain-containing protein, partial [Finegoldia magna]|nr:Fe-S-binding domain-containing protein [Finegoldia magna]